MVVSELASSEALPNGTEYVLFLNEHSPESYDLRISPRNLMGADDGLQRFATKAAFRLSCQFLIARTKL